MEKDMATDGATASGSVIELTAHMRSPPMQIPNSAPPKPRLRSSPPAEVRELGAVFVGTDNLLSGLQQNARLVMGALLSALSPDDAREAVMRAVRIAITDALKEEIKR